MKKIRGIRYAPKLIHNDGVKHPDFDDSVLTSIVDFYRRFVTDPDFKVNQLPVEYDLKESPFDRGTAADDQLIESEEPEYGQADLEYMMNAKSQRDSKRAAVPTQDAASDATDSVPSDPKD